MVQSCSAYGCKNRYHKDKNISFHKFPLARPEVCVKWIAAMRRRDFKPTKYSNICSQHFTKDCFKRECNNRVLKENAVPSLFGGGKLQIKSESIEDSFTSALDFSVALPLSDHEEESSTILLLQEQHKEKEDDDIRRSPTPGASVATATSVSSVAMETGHTLIGAAPSTSVSYDHNYTAEDSYRQHRRIEQLEEQVDRLRRRLKASQQRCRRQERQLRRLQQFQEAQGVRERKRKEIGRGFVVLPEEVYRVLQGVEQIT
ncbi:THAP domain-containing protein 1 [Polymixia lowei]